MYAPKDKKELIVPVRLDADSSFCFSCDRDLSCFTRCCRNVHIMLTPYDVIRLKKRVGLYSEDFLRAYTTPGLIQGSELPVPVLKLRNDDEKTCPFLTKEGCAIYEDRPSTCRYYPISSGVFHNHDASEDEQFYAMVKEGHCLGHDMGREWTVREWRADQGLDEYDKANAGWVELILKRKSLGPFVTIPDKTLQMFFLGCYNLDNFRGFVLSTRFLQVYDVPEERIAKIEKDDAALLDFAVDWLKSTLFGENRLKIRQTLTAAAD